MMKMIKWIQAVIMLAVGCLAPGGALKASPVTYDFIDETITRQVIQGIEHIYNLDYGPAIEIFQELIQQYPKNPIGYTYLSFALWTRELNNKKELTIGSVASPEFFGATKRFRVLVDPKVEAEFLEVTQKAIDASKALLLENQEDPLGLLMLGYAYGHLASFETTLKRSWYIAFLKGDLAVKQHKRLMRRRPDVYDAYETVGTSSYVAASVSAWWLKVVAFFFRHSGDKKRGKELLRLTAEKAIFVRDDAKMLLALIATREGNYSEAHRLLADIQGRHQKNYLLEMDMGTLAMLMRRYDLAEQTYQAVLNKVAERKPNYFLLDKGTVYNHLGELYMKTRNFSKALLAFQNTLAEGKSDSASLNTAHLQLGKVYDLMGDRAKALHEYQKVVDEPTLTEGRDEARKYLEKPYTASRD
ncbi:MAG: tetratricopeptide repeat protein [Acidobacteria bacterium]|nr:tetratricopeptide repeat protein [Acidobacteriota bacterium]